MSQWFAWISSLLLLTYWKIDDPKAEYFANDFVEEINKEVTKINEDPVKLEAIMRYNLHIEDINNININNPNKYKQ